MALCDRKALLPAHAKLKLQLSSQSNTSSEASMKTSESLLISPNTYAWRNDQRASEPYTLHVHLQLKCLISRTTQFRCICFIWWLTQWKEQLLNAIKYRHFKAKDRENKKGIGLWPHPKVTPACQEEGSVEEPKTSKATSGTEKGLWKRRIILTI